MRRKIIFTVLLITALFLPFSAFAAETTLTAVVPDYSIQLEIAGNGSVEVNGQCYTQNATISVKRFTAVDFRILAGTDSELTGVLYQGKDVLSELQNDTLMLSQVEDGAVLSVTFSPKSATSPKTGDSAAPLWIYGISMLLATAIALTAAKKWRSVSQ